MSNNKLQELTEQLYSEGLSKGRIEGEKVLADARAEADKIISEARSQAEKIILDAQKNAEDTFTKALSDVKMAAGQVLSSTKAAITGAIENKGAISDIDAALGDKNFIKEIIRSVAERFSTENDGDMSVILPESLKGEVEDYVKSEVASTVGKGIDVAIGKKIKGGFSIGPGNGGYFVSMSDETFKELICEYLRPATRKILFGE